MVIGDLNIVDSIENFFIELFEWLPRVVAFVAILIVGYFIAKFLGGLVRRGLERVGLNRWVQRGFGGSWVGRVVQDPSHLLGVIAFWILFIAAISIAVDVLGINALEDAIRAVWGYVPNILAALAIFLVASAIAGAVVALVNRTMGETGTGRIVRAVAPTLIMAIAVFMMLDQLMIAEDIVVITYAALMGALGLGFALAFGLGGRDVAGTMLGNAYQSAQVGIPKAKADIEQGKQRARQEADRLQRDLPPEPTTGFEPTDPPPPPPDQSV
jgi:hypothetical protein